MIESILCLSLSLLVDVSRIISFTVLSSDFRLVSSTVHSTSAVSTPQPVHTLYISTTHIPTTMCTYTYQWYICNHSYFIWGSSIEICTNRFLSGYSSDAWSIGKIHQRWYRRQRNWHRLLRHVQASRRNLQGLRQLLLPRLLRGPYSRMGTRRIERGWDLAFVIGVTGIWDWATFRGIPGQALGEGVCVDYSSGVDRIMLF